MNEGHEDAASDRGSPVRGDARVTVVGSYNHDLSMIVPAIPAPGETVLGRGFQEGHGGKGSNQAVAAARLGARTSFVGRVGADRFGERARTLWEEEGIDYRWTGTTDAERTGVAFVTIDESGENAISVAEGANTTLEGTHVRDATNAIESADVLLMQLEIPDGPITAAVECAGAGGRTGNTGETGVHVSEGSSPVGDGGTEVVLDPAPVRDLPDTVLRRIDVITPNRIEARTLAGCTAEGDVDDETVALRLRKRYDLTVVITLGSDGALLASSSETVHVPAVDPPGRVVDTTGAGDAFAGAFAVARAGGQGYRHAVQWGVTAGALACTTRGAVPSLPAWDTLAALLAE